jgi:hypothetical protein
MLKRRIDVHHNASPGHWAAHTYFYLVDDSVQFIRMPNGKCQTLQQRARNGMWTSDRYAYCVDGGHVHIFDSDGNRLEQVLDMPVGMIFTATAAGPVFIWDWRHVSRYKDGVVEHAEIPDQYDLLSISTVDGLLGLYTNYIAHEITFDELARGEAPRTYSGSDHRYDEATHDSVYWIRNSQWFMSRRLDRVQRVLGVLS